MHDFPLMDQRLKEGLPRLYVPEPGRPVSTPGGQDLAVGTESHDPDPVLMGQGRAERRSGAEVPKSGVVVLAAGGKDFPIRADGQGDDLARMAQTEPEGVDLRARLPGDVRPSDVQHLLEDAVTVPVRSDPRIMLEEIDGDEIVLRIHATPEEATEGPKLANEILSAVSGIARDGANGSGPEDEPSEPAWDPETQQRRED